MLSMSKQSSDLDSFRSKTYKRAITHDPTTFGYEVMTKSNIGWRPYWILRLWRRQWAPALAPSKNEFSVFWSTSVPNFMLVDKCAQKIPKLLHYNDCVGFWALMLATAVVLYYSVHPFAYWCNTQHNVMWWIIHSLLAQPVLLKSVN